MVWCIMVLGVMSAPTRHPRFIRLYQVTSPDGSTRVVNQFDLDSQAPLPDKMVFFGAPGRTDMIDMRPVQASIRDPAYQSKEGRQAIVAELQRSAQWMPVASIMAEMVLAGERERMTAHWLAVIGASAAQWCVLIGFLGVPIWILAAVVAGSAQARIKPSVIAQSPANAQRGTS